MGLTRYDKPALRLVSGSTGARRPTVGDRVVLTSDYASYSDAAGGAWMFCCCSLAHLCFHLPAHLLHCASLFACLSFRDRHFVACHVGGNGFVRAGPLAPGDVGVIEKDDGSGTWGMSVCDREGEGERLVGGL